MPARFTLLVATLSLCPASTIRTQGSVDELIARAEVQLTEKQPEGAARTLHDAHRAAQSISSADARDDATERVAAIAVRVDKRFGTRMQMEQKAAERFAAVARSYLKRGLPHTAEVALAYGQLYSPAVVADLQTEAKSTRGGPEDEELATRYRDYSEYIWGFAAAKQAEKDPVFAEFWPARGTSAHAAIKLADKYAKAGWHEIGYELALLAKLTANSAVYEQVAERRAGLVDHRAKQRFEMLAKPHMAAFKKGCVKLGKAKRWRIQSSEITGPVPADDWAVVVAKQKLTGDYRIEADFKFTNMIGQAYLVFGYLDKNDYCALEFDRPTNNYALRLCRFRGGVKQVLGVVAAPQLLGGWHRFAVEVRGGAATGRYHALQPQPEPLFERQLATPNGPLRIEDAEVSATIPSDLSAGAAWGFAQGPYKGSSKKQKTRARRQVRYRNLVITPLD